MPAARVNERRRVVLNSPFDRGAPTRLLVPGSTTGDNTRPRTSDAALGTLRVPKAEIDTVLDRIRTTSQDHCPLIEAIQACRLRFAQIALAPGRETG